MVVRCGHRVRRAEDLAQVAAHLVRVRVGIRVRVRIRSMVSGEGVGVRVRVRVAAHAVDAAVAEHVR